MQQQQQCCNVGSCSCCSTALFSDAATHNNNTHNFSVFFSIPSHPKPPLSSANDESPVDCTLSLGTPSTRSTTGYETERGASGGACMQNFCWDSIQHPKQYSSSSANSCDNGNTSSGNDRLLARRCANCDTTSTPLWRNGPRGPKSLCNACGIRFKKEERRAAAATAGSVVVQPPTSVPHVFNSPTSWINAHTTMQSHKIPSCFSTAAIGNEFRYAEDESVPGRESEISFLSWRLSVAERPGLVNEFTR